MTTTTSHQPTSGVEVAPVTQRRMLVSERINTRSLRSTALTLLAARVATVAFGWLTGWATGSTRLSNASATIPSREVQRRWTVAFATPARHRTHGELGVSAFDDQIQDRFDDASIPRLVTDGPKAPRGRWRPVG